MILQKRQFGSATDRSSFSVLLSWFFLLRKNIKAYTNLRGSIRFYEERSARNEELPAIPDPCRGKVERLEIGLHFIETIAQLFFDHFHELVYDHLAAVTRHCARFAKNALPQYCWNSAVGDPRDNDVGAIKA